MWHAPSHDNEKGPTSDDMHFASSTQIKDKTNVARSGDAFPITALKIDQIGLETLSPEFKQHIDKILDDDHIVKVNFPQDVSKLSTVRAFVSHKWT